MIFECRDLERALRSPELMPDARAHAQNCERCRDSLFLWSEISRVAPELHQDWESPELWGRIAVGIAAEPRPIRKRNTWAIWAMAAAAMLLIATALFRPWATEPKSRDFLTEQTLAEVQASEAAYVRSIGKLSAIAGQTLENSPSPLAAAYREKLRVLDAEILDLRANVENDLYSSYLRNQLAVLYRDKQRTLEDWTKYAKTN